MFYDDMVMKADGARQRGLRKKTWWDLCRRHGEFGPVLRGCTDLHSLGIYGEGKNQGGNRLRCSPDRMVVKTVCACVCYTGECKFVRQWVMAQLRFDRNWTALYNHSTAMRYDRMPYLLWTAALAA